MVGSAFGLYPYSSTSFRLCSSASFLCFLLRQKKIPARTRRATAAIGTTTATAIFPLLFRPPLELSLGLIAAPEVLETGGGIPEPVPLGGGAVTVSILVTVEPAGSVVVIVVRDDCVVGVDVVEGVEVVEGVVSVVGVLVVVGVVVVVVSGGGGVGDGVGVGVGVVEVSVGMVVLFEAMAKV